MCKLLEGTLLDIISKWEGPLDIRSLRGMTNRTLNKRVPTQNIMRSLESLQNNKLVEIIEDVFVEERADEEHIDLTDFCFMSISNKWKYFCRNYDE